MARSTGGPGQAQKNSGKDSSDTEKTSVVQLTPEELTEFYIVFVFCEDGTFFKFKIHVKTHKSTMLEAYSLTRLLEKDVENWDKSLDSNASNAAGITFDSGFGGPSGTAPPKPHEIKINAVSRWGNQGFVIGGTSGYVGLLKHNASEKFDLQGPYWIDRGTFKQSIRLITEYRDAIIPKRLR